MDDKISFDRDRAMDSSSRGKRRRRLAGGTTALLVIGAMATMLWPFGGAPAPQRAEAFPDVASITRILIDAVKEEKVEQREARPTLHGGAIDFAATTKAKPTPAPTKPAAGKPATTKPKPGKPATKKPAGKPTPKKPAKGKPATGKPKKPRAKATGSAVPASEAVMSSAVPGVPAGHAALAVAREFAQAFVVYETGGEKKTFKAGFDATATTNLTKALLQRPPRQPADGKVPKAKVVNVVAGPSKGRVYTVSASLLRVGVTSELRLEMERGVGGKWQVTNVLG